MTTQGSDLGESESEVYSISSFLCCFVCHPLPTYSFIHPSIFLSTHSPTHLLRLLSISPNHPTLHSPSHPAIHPAIRLSNQPLTDPLFYSSTHPSTCSLTPLSTQPSTYSSPSKHSQNPTVCQMTFLPWWRLQASGGGVRKQLG